MDAPVTLPLCVFIGSDVMGVRGLTTYVEGNRNFLQHVKLRDSRLVIDGCSLYYSLYYNGLDQPHGGDYDAFALLLSQFLSALKACNIQPYVVLDGGNDKCTHNTSHCTNNIIILPLQAFILYLSVFL